MAKKRLEEAAAAASTAEKRVAAEIEALETDLEKERARASEALEELRAAHAEELRREREAKDRVVAEAEGRLAEIEAQAEAAEKRIEDGRETRRRGRGRDRRRAGARSRGGGGLAARSGRGDPARGGAAIAPSAEFDVAVVGGGAAGLWTALQAAEDGGSVCLVSRTPLSQSASFWAQGGLAAALEPGDSPGPARRRHDRGRTRALPALGGAGPGRRGARRPSQELRSRGVVFDLDPDGELSLGLEGGHTRRRIVHSGGSATGHEITSKLAAMVAAEPRIEVRERASMTALWSDGERCHGVLTDDGRIAAAATVLATGGAAALWRRTSNPRGAIGAGPTMAAAAGADLADLEFCQFHPTALFLPGTRFDGLLITEAVRGEGATLLDAAGRRFTDELAPRDAVTAAILDRLEADGTDAVTLDLRELDPARFPNVFESLARGRARPDRRADPGRSGRPLHDGRDRGRPRRPLLAARPLRGRRVLLHRPARRQPARLQLAQRVLRLRRPRRAGGAGGDRRAQPPRAPASGASSRRPRRPATRSGTSPARCARPEQLSSCSEDPYPLAAAIADLRPGAPRVARRPPARRLPGARSRARRHPHRLARRRRGSPRELALS